VNSVVSEGVCVLADEVLGRIHCWTCLGIILSLKLSLSLHLVSLVVDAESLSVFDEAGGGQPGEELGRLTRLGFSLDLIRHYLVCEQRFGFR